MLFNTRLMLIGGKVRRTGAKGVSIMAENAWRLDELWDQWQLKKKLATTEVAASFDQAS
jgi:error-prone DNA polymerase